VVRDLKAMAYAPSPSSRSGRQRPRSNAWCVMWPGNSASLHSPSTTPARVSGAVDYPPRYFRRSSGRPRSLRCRGHRDPVWPQTDDGRRPHRHIGSGIATRASFHCLAGYPPHHRLRCRLHTAPRATLVPRASPVLYCSPGRSTPTEPEGRRAFAEAHAPNTLCSANGTAATRAGVWQPASYSLAIPGASFSVTGTVPVDGGFGALTQQLKFNFRNSRRKSDLLQNSGADQAV